MMFDPNRIIRIEGEGLLPPCYEPQIPADIKENERVRVIPPSPPWRATTSDDIIMVMEGRSPQDQRYWFFGEAHEYKMGSFEWEGDPRTGPGIGRFGSGMGLDSIAEGTIFHFETRSTKKKLPDIWKPFGSDVLIASKRVLDVLLEYDADAIDHRSLIFKNANDEILSDPYYFIDIIRNIKAIDIANSIVDYKGSKTFAPDDIYPPFLSRFVSSKIRDDLDDNCHIFRQKRFNWDGGDEIIISNKLKQAFQAVKPKLKNLRFTACGK